MGILSLDTQHPLEDLIDARAYLDMIIRRRQGEKIDRDIAAGITGVPLDLKKGAPENKLAHLVEETKQLEIPLPEISASMMAPSEIADASIAKASEAAEDKPKRGRKPKPEVVKTVSVDEVRALMVERSQMGAEEQQRQRSILTKMGFAKLSEVPPERLVELLAAIKGE